MFRQLPLYLAIVVIFSSGQTVLSAINGTFPFPPQPVDYESPESMQVDDGHSGNYFSPFPFPKKPPYHQSAFPEHYNTLWLVPVLRYLIAININSILLHDNPVIALVPVTLAAATHWWFHEQQVIDRMHQRNETVVGDPFFIAEGVDGNGGKKSTIAPVASTDKKQSSSPKAASKALASGPGDKSSRQDDKRSDNAIHSCGSRSCPACHFEPCHCQDCSPATEPAEENAKTDSEATIGSGEEPMEQGLNIADDPDTTAADKRTTPFCAARNIVLLLRERAITGRLHYRLGPSRHQAVLELISPVLPELEFTAHTRHEHERSILHEHWCGETPCTCRQSGINIPVRAVIPMENNAFLSWAENGIKIWTVHGEGYTSDEVPSPPLEINKVFVIKSDHIVIWLKNAILLERRKIDGIWRSNDMAPLITHIEQFPNGQLVSFSQDNQLLGIWLHDDQFLKFTEVSGFNWLQRLSTIVVISDSRFMTVTDVEDNEGGVHTWNKQGHQWLSEEYYKPSPSSRISRLTVCSDGSLLILETRGGRLQTMAWKESSREWSALPQFDDMYNLNVFGGILPDGRIYIISTPLPSSSENIPDPRSSLALLCEAKTEWKATAIYSCPRGQDILCDAMIQLSDERLVAACTITTHTVEVSFSEQGYHVKPSSIQLVLERDIRLFMESEGVWLFATFGYSESRVLGMVVQNESRLITWYADGCIKIWNLYP